MWRLSCFSIICSLEDALIIRSARPVGLVLPALLHRLPEDLLVRLVHRDPEDLLVRPALRGLADLLVHPALRGLADRPVSSVRHVRMGLSVHFVRRDPAVHLVLFVRRGRADRLVLSARLHRLRRNPAAVPVDCMNVRRIVEDKGPALQVLANIVPAAQNLRVINVFKIGAGPQPLSLINSYRRCSDTAGI